MDLSSIDFDSGRDIFAQAVRGIRRKRDLKAAQVAERMGMPLRSYELFEAGGGRLSPQRIQKFAQATDSDPFALMLSIIFGHADFAIICADTKLALISVMHLHSFFDERGPDLAYLEPTKIILGLRRLFADLGSGLDDEQAFMQRWFDDRTGSISLGDLSIRGVRKDKA